MCRAIPITVLFVALSTACAARDGKRRDAAPEPPATLTHYVTGEDADADVTPSGGLLLMGGGTDVDAAFEWASQRAAGGDVVILRTSGADGYNDYLFDDIGGFDSVETLLVTSTALASDEYVRWRVEHAEVIFLAGGDQWTYLDAWRDTPLEDALHTAFARGAVLGGTSAGLAVLGELVFSAENGTVTSPEALADPFDPLVALDGGFLALDSLTGVVTDSHFGARDRLGRLISFVARAETGGLLDDPLGVGVDEETALVIDASGAAEVLGNGNVYLVTLGAGSLHCVPGDPLAATADVVKLVPGATATFPGGSAAVAPYAVVASNGALEPASPY